MLNMDPSELNSAQPIKKQKFYQILYVQVIFAIVVGILLGHFFPHTGEAMKPLGDAFIKIVGYRTHKYPLREVTNLAGWDKAIHLCGDGGGFIIVVNCY